jgi:hypothetical protein
MRAWLREAAVTVAAAVFMAGAVSAAALPLLPVAWRRPVVVWGILLASLVLMAGLRRRLSTPR